MSARTITPAVPVARRVAWDGIWYPAIGTHFGLPAFGFKSAPTGLATRRQLRKAGLCPGGAEPVAVLLWRRGRRFVWLYRVDVARPKRVPSPGQLAALGRAMTVRRTCRNGCGVVVGYCVPTSTGQCWPCSLADLADNADDPGDSAEDRGERGRAAA